MDSQKVVTPAKAGVHEFVTFLKRLDSGFRRNDGETPFWTICECIKTQTFMIRILSRFISPSPLR